MGIGALWRKTVILLAGRVPKEHGFETDQKKKKEFYCFKSKYHRKGIWCLWLGFTFSRGPGIGAEDCVSSAQRGIMGWRWLPKRQAKLCCSDYISSPLGRFWKSRGKAVSEPSVTHHVLVLSVSKGLCAEHFLPLVSFKPSQPPETVLLASPPFTDKNVGAFDGNLAQAPAARKW